MKPKQTFRDKKEIARRKNRIHWATHKHKISAKRNERKIEQVQTGLSLSDDFSQLQVGHQSNVITEILNDGTHACQLSHGFYNDFYQNNNTIDDRHEVISTETNDCEEDELIEDFIDENNYDDDDEVEVHADTSFLQTIIPDSSEREHDELV